MQLNILDNYDIAKLKYISVAGHNSLSDYEIADKVYRGRNCKINLETPVKLLSNDLQSYDYLYKEGFNVDIRPFEQRKEFGMYNQFGLHFTTLRYMPCFSYLGWSKIAEVIDYDKQNYQIDKAEIQKSHSLTLGPIIGLKDHPCWKDPIYCEYAVCVYTHSLLNVFNQTDELCRLAISINPHTIMDVRNPTKKLCDYAIKLNPQMRDIIEKERNLGKILI